MEKVNLFFCFHEYEGDWLDDKMTDKFGKIIEEGKCKHKIYYFRKYTLFGAVYIGEFKNNKRDGKGKMIDKSNKVIN